MADAMGLTPAQAHLARVIAELTNVFGRPPSLTEIGHEMDGKSSAFHLLQGLRDRGWLASRRPIVLAHPAPPLPPEGAIEVTAAGRAALACGGI